MPPEPCAPSLRVTDFSSADDFSRLWNTTDFLALPRNPKDRYWVGFANSDRCVEEAQRLRFEVFNVELGEGLQESISTGLDRDEFDDQMTHLVLMAPATGRIVGTYRIQTVRYALQHKGIYSAQEFDLSAMGPYLDTTIELGRAYLAADHRSYGAILSLWLGIGAFMNLYEQKYLFGCSSLTTQDPDDGWRAMKTIREKEFLHPDLFMPATERYSCGAPTREFDSDLGDALALPKLFRTYMRLGAQVISEPAIDREFGTVDFLTMMDGHKVTLSPLDVLK